MPSPVWLPRGALWLRIGSQTFGILSTSLKLAEMTCWMKSVSKITQYLPLKSTIMSLSYRAFSIRQVFQGICSNSKKESGTLATPRAAVFQTVFFEKTLLNSVLPQKHVCWSLKSACTSDHQLFTALSALSSEQGLMHPICTLPVPCTGVAPRHHLRAEPGRLRALLEGDQRAPPGSVEMLWRNS